MNLARRIVTLPPGVKLDSGGLAKGLFADVPPSGWQGAPPGEVTVEQLSGCARPRVSSP